VRGLEDAVALTVALAIKVLEADNNVVALTETVADKATFEVMATWPSEPPCPTLDAPQEVGNEAAL
jgi:hypothetical protein